MRILKIIWETAKEDLDMEEWLRNCLNDMTDCIILPTEVYE